MIDKNSFELLEKYRRKFGQNFPTMCFLGASISEVNAAIEKCIKQGKPAEEIFGLDYTNKY